VRFVSSSGVSMMIPKGTITTSRCSTSAPGSLTTDHPTTIGQNISGTICYNWAGNSCNWSNQISITKCGDYYVYQLPITPVCDLRYCTTNPY